MIKPMINQWLERWFGNNSNNSRDQVKQRLQVILAHDRLAITPQMLEQMRQEIMAVVAKYVEIDQEAIEISLEADQRITMMVASLPITGLKSTEIQPTAEESANIVSEQQPLELTLEPTSDQLQSENSD